MAEPHLAVEQAEDVVIVDVGGDGVDGRPRRVLEEPIADALERRLVHLVDLVHVLLPNVAVHVHHERLHGVRDIVRIVAGGGVAVCGMLGIVRRSAGHGGVSGGETSGPELKFAFPVCL